MKAKTKNNKEIKFKETYLTLICKRNFKNFLKTKFSSKIMKY